MSLLFFRKYDYPNPAAPTNTDVIYWDDQEYYMVYRYPLNHPAVVAVNNVTVMNAVVPGGVEIERGDSLTNDQITWLGKSLVETGGAGGGVVTPTESGETKIINRSNNTQSVAPTAGEFPTPIVADYAMVILQDKTVETWSYNTGVWVRSNVLQPSAGEAGQTKIINRSNNTQSVAPTGVEFATPIVDDFALVILQNKTVETWSYATGAWVRTNYLPSDLEFFSTFATRPTGLGAIDTGRTLVFTKTGNFHRWTGTAWEVLGETEINVLDYGAGAGAADDTVLLQPVFDRIRDTGEAIWGKSSNKVKPIIFPADTDYKIETSLVYYSSFYIKGGGATSKLITTNANLGSFLVMEENILTSVADTHWNSRVEFLHFVDNSTLITPGVPNQIAMIKNATGKSANNCYWGNLWQGCALGVISDVYSQYCEAYRFFPTQKCEQFLNIIGNCNTAKELDKEGSSPISTIPFILFRKGVDDATGNKIVNCLIEGGGIAGKPCIELINGRDTHIENIWNEFGFSTSATITIKATDTKNTKILGYYHGSELKRIELIGNSDITIEELNYVSTTTTSFHDLFIIDNNCTVRINKLITRANLDIGLLNKSRQFIVDRVVQTDIVDALPAARAGYCNTQKIHESNSHNRLINGSFAVGIHGWSFDGSPITSLVSGLIGSGQSLQADKADGSSVILRQNFVTTADMIGQVFTLSFYARILTANVGAAITPHISGGGIVSTNAFSQLKTIGNTAFIQQSFEVQAAGTIQVGCRSNAITSFVVDHFCLNAGLVSANGSGEVQDLSLNNLFIGSGTATPVSPPGAGSWEKGDLFFNKNAAVGTTPFIQCTTAGEGTASVWSKAPELKEGRDIISVTGATTVTFPTVTLPGTPVFTPAVPAGANRVYSLNTGQLAAWDGTQYIATTSSMRSAWSGNTGAANVAIEPVTTNQKIRREGLTGFAKDPISQVDTTSLGANNRALTTAAVTMGTNDFHMRLTATVTQTLTLIDPTVTPQADKLVIVSNPTAVAKSFAVAVTGLDGVATTAIAASSTYLLQCIGTNWVMLMRSA